VAQRVDGPWLSVQKLIELFTAMGCTLGTVPGRMHGPNEESWEVRYLYSPVTDDFVPLSDLDNDDILGPTEIENWERRLGIVVPKGKNH
jgi:hypothetical protein